MCTLTAALIWISLMIGNVDRFPWIHWLFVYLLFRNIYSYLLAIVIELFVFLVLSWGPYIMGLFTCCQMYVLQIFSLILCTISLLRSFLCCVDMFWFDTISFAYFTLLPLFLGSHLKKIIAQTNWGFPLLFYCCAGWGYTVTFIKVLTIYQIYHSWIHHLHHCPFSPLAHS
jgi:hypothetical protein